MTIPTQFTWKKIDQPRFTPRNLLANPAQDLVVEQQAALQKGYEEGFAQGRTAGEAAAVEHHKELTAQCEALLSEMQAARAATTHRILGDVKVVYAELFKVLFNYEVTASAELMTHLVKRAEDYLAGPCLRVHVHSSQEQVLREALQASPLANLLIVDDTITPGAVGVSDDLNLVALDPVAGFQAIVQSMADPELLDATGPDNDPAAGHAGPEHDPE